jgi:hypothetical protein
MRACVTAFSLARRHRTIAAMNRGGTEPPTQEYRCQRRDLGRSFTILPRGLLNAAAASGAAAAEEDCRIRDTHRAASTVKALSLSLIAACKGASVSAALVARGVRHYQAGSHAACDQRGHERGAASKPE